MVNFQEENWIAFLAEKKGVSGWKLMEKMGKVGAVYQSQRKPLSKGFKLLCDFMDYGFSPEEIMEALQRHRRLGREG